MGGSGGGMVQGPTPEETEQTNLQNQLLRQQLEDAARQRAEDDYKKTPEYLNQQLATTRAKQQQEYNTNKNNTYQKARQGIIDQFTAFGDANAATPYLQALEKQYNSLGYHSGGDYTTTYNSHPGRVPVTRENFNEQQFLRDNPDVAASYGFANGDPSYYQSAEDYLNRTGDWGKRTISGTVTDSSVNAPAADTWDDYTSLLNSDYGAGEYITGKRQERKDTAYNSARGQANDYLAALGLDDKTMGELRGLVDTTFGSQYNTVGNSANDYSNVFDPQAVVSGATNKLTTARRGIYTTQANKLFSGVDPNSDFTDTADDQYINDIVGSQYTDAFNALDRARARGALTDTGFSSGLNYLGQQKNTALSTAQTLGGAVLQRDRDALGSIKSGALTGASGYTLGTDFDANKYLTDYTTKKGALAGSLQGDISSALAGQNWFDVGDVLNKAGYAQGAQNTKPLIDGFGTPAAAAIAENQQKNKDANRGLGGAGVF